MKCAKPGCEKDASPTHKYCSRSCAPFAHLLGDRRKNSESIYSTGKSNTVDGVQLVRRSKGVNSKRAAMIAERARRKDWAARVGFGCRPKDEQNLIASELNEKRMTQTERKNGETGMHETGLNIAGKKYNAGFGGTQSTDLNPLPINSEEESVQAMTLIDESVKSLHKLMKGITGTENENVSARVNPHMVNAVANCAKQITGLLRLKLDIVKEARK